MSDTAVVGARTKYERISELYERHALEITGNAERWADFLTSAAAMYKYPWADQALIHAQRPDAVACASIQMWNGFKQTEELKR